MPTYEYRCEACGHQFVEILSMSKHDTFRPQCPQCKSDKIARIPGTVFVKASRKA